ncbi:MAG: allophanate hydrolase subunit 1 [Mycobacteriales bacterium]
MRTIRPYGPDAFLLECPDEGEAVDLHLGLLAHPVPGVVQTVPGAQSLLVECAGPSTRRDAERVLAVLPAPPRSVTPTEHVLEVRYDGPDLSFVADQHGLSVDEVVRLHTSSECAVALTGFAPGFAYLSGLAAVLATPRRADPRPAVPAGSVAIGGPWTGVYPRRGPGGWNLLGTTDAVLWDLDRDPPAVLQLGDTVRFRAV